MIVQYDTLEEPERLDTIITNKEWNRLTPPVRGCIVGNGSEVEYHGYLLCENNGNYCPFTQYERDVRTLTCVRDCYSVRVLSGE